MIFVSYVYSRDQISTLTASLHIKLIEFWYLFVLSIHVVKYQHLPRPCTSSSLNFDICLLCFFTWSNINPYCVFAHQAHCNFDLFLMFIHVVKYQPLLRLCTSSSLNFDICLLCLFVWSNINTYCVFSHQAHWILIFICYVYSRGRISTLTAFFAHQAHWILIFACLVYSRGQTSTLHHVQLLLFIIKSSYIDCFLHLLWEDPKFDPVIEFATKKKYDT